MERSSFYDDVYEVVRLIPKGRVTTFGAIARYLGTGLSSRMVGWALKASPQGVPAHRVVNRAGILSGKHHFGHPCRMQELLEEEGVRVVNDEVQNFSGLLWDPQSLSLE
ncbi:MAG: MGMT family protein [Crocinitomicaceae bacterium]|nr:MGMT family protein [Crocinitomicaceae bacterium]